MENLKYILSVINDINTIQKQIDDINTGRSDEFDLDELEEDLDFYLMLQLLQYLQKQEEVLKD